LKTLTSIQPELGYYFQCVWDEATDIVKEFEEAQIRCGTHEVQCDYLQNEDTAMIHGTSMHEQLNRAEVECIHTYLLAHGWTLEDTS
jgi:hypothetical protein